jgi:hypothetical protein
VRKSNFCQYLHGSIDRVAMVGNLDRKVMKGGDAHGGHDGSAGFPCSDTGHLQYGG